MARCTSRGAVLVGRERACHICVPIFQFVDSQWNNCPIGLLVQVCGEQHACTCIANIFKWANNEGQHVCRAIGVVLRDQTTVVFRAKGKGTPPPPVAGTSSSAYRPIEAPVAYPKGHRVGGAPQVFCYAKV